jgi:hypothetical protein
MSFSALITIWGGLPPGSARFLAALGGLEAAPGAAFDPGQELIVASAWPGAIHRGQTAPG